jgi:hypothetical protein
MNQALDDRDRAAAVAGLPADVADLLVANPCLTVAGGYLRTTIAREPETDIDIFGPTPGPIGQAARRLSAARKAVRTETGSAITIASPGLAPVQFITKWTGPRAQLLHGFDFTVCQAAIWWDGKKWTTEASRRFYGDLAAKRLCYCAPGSDADPGASLLRAHKMIARGYRIPREDLSKLLAGLIGQIETEGKAGPALAASLARALHVYDEVTP